jgi:hypothetical protein
MQEHGQIGVEDAATCDLRNDNLQCFND